jgi:hypothetical protein
MNTLKINKNYKNKFSIEPFNNNRFNLIFEEGAFIIDFGIAFKNCFIYVKWEPYKIKIQINKNDKEHQKFKKLIEYIYEVVKEYIEDEKEEILTDNIINPLDTKEEFDLLFGIINKKTIIKNIDTQKTLQINDLVNKKFDMYPIFYAPNFNVYNDKIYINFVLHTIFVRIEEDKEISINLDNVVKVMNKLSKSQT